MVERKGLKMRVYVMRYYKNGEQTKISLPAKTIVDADRKAKAIMYHENIHTAWLVRPSGGQVLLSL